MVGGFAYNLSRLPAAHHRPLLAVPPPDCQRDIAVAFKSSRKQINLLALPVCHLFEIIDGLAL